MPSKTKKSMSFHEALKILNIEEFEKRIFESNSRGELFHLADYIAFASIKGDKRWFRPRFLKMVKAVEKSWARPESVFQHLGRFM